ncbi:hypothetical protein BGW80DRAFT_1460913 [Lactifluus volemus]|nr:hypothetical protein BGW80DRAFT_1460913 [Lactifluus volemus]
MSASDQTPPSSPTDSSSPPPMLPIKRKASEEPDDPQDGTPSSSKDFEAGRVTCESCGKSVSYRDENTGTFTTKHWDAHKVGCSAPSSVPPPSPPQSHAPPTGPSTVTVSAGPPSKRRRAKRTEEERIQYLRSDPYVAQFEPYRVLCASCDKWIRLRPNSTYCSIPWDAHRKSCLARKGPKEPPPPFVAGDPDARKYDGERVLLWSKHRAECRPASPSVPPASSAIPSVPPPSQHQMALVSSLPIPTSTATKEKDHPPSPLISSSPQPPSTAHLSDTPSSAPGPGAVSESRRRNAEQRAAQLRADPLLAQVEPHRVFCALCRKWVQLRQDSTFCAYPWQQHRSKCVIRHDKKTKAVAGGSMSHSGCVTPASGDESTENGELGPEGEELDTAEDADGVPDAHAADSHAPRFTHLGSSADRLSFTGHSIAYLFRTTYTPTDALTIAALVAYMNAALPPDKHEEFDTAEVTRAAKTLHDRDALLLKAIHLSSYTETSPVVPLPSPFLLPSRLASSISSQARQASHFGQVVPIGLRVPDWISLPRLFFKYNLVIFCLNVTPTDLITYC